jgi:tetratricopeptide (TPR) repeat protein
LGRAAEALFAKARAEWTESWATEILRLARAGDAKTLALAAADWLMRVWDARHAYRETERVGDSLLEIGWRDHNLLRNLAVAKRTLGDGARALALFEAALTEFPDAEKSDRARTLYDFSELLIQQGQTERALQILQTEVIPFLESVGDDGNRAATLGRIADIWQAQGRLEEALRILQEELLPAFERLNDMRSRAVTLGRIADIWQAQGRLEEALRIRREEQLPTFERLNDVHERAVTLGYIADIWARQGRLEEALRIRREEELPAFERLNDVRSRAVTLGKIADIWEAQGRLEEALRLYEEALGVHHGMNDVHGVAHVLARIAQILSAQGDFAGALDCLGKAEEIFAHLQSPDVERVRQLTQQTQFMQLVAARLGDAKMAQLTELLQAGDGEAARRFLQAHLGDDPPPAA